MVSLEDRVGYYCSIEDKPKIVCFNHFVSGKRYDASVQVGISDTDTLYYGLIASTTDNNRSGFESAYNEFSRRRPSLDAPWIFNDFLIFVLICGISKYSLSKDWIIEVLQTRTTTNPQHARTTKTFTNLLNDNIQSTDNLNSIVVVFLDLLNKPQLPKSSLDNLYLSLSANWKLMENRNDFLIAVSVRAFDLILLSKETPDAIEVVNLRKFRQTFMKRVRITSNILYALLIISFIGFGVLYLRRHEDFKGYLSDIGVILQITGLALAFAFKYIRKLIEQLLLKWLGYLSNFPHS